MTGSDWIIIALLVAVFIFLHAFDELVDRRTRRIDRADRAAEHRRLMREIRRQP